MNGFAKIIDDGKKLFAAIETRFNAIQSPPAKIAASLFAALILLMIVWAVLPWIGFIIAFVVVAFVVRAFWPAAPGAGK
jgi:fatty acid desaturase